MAYSHTIAPTHCTSTIYKKQNSKKVAHSVDQERRKSTHPSEDQDPAELPQMRRAGIRHSTTSTSQIQPATSRKSHSVSSGTGSSHPENGTSSNYTYRRKSSGKHSSAQGAVGSVSVTSTLHKSSPIHEKYSNLGAEYSRWYPKPGPAAFIALDTPPAALSPTLMFEDSSLLVTEKEDMERHIDWIEASLLECPKVTFVGVDCCIPISVSIALQLVQRGLATQLSCSTKTISGSDGNPKSCIVIEFTRGRNSLKKR